MASRHTTNRRRSYGRRVHELRERMHEERRYSRDELRVGMVDEGISEPAYGSWDRMRADAD